MEDERIIMTISRFDGMTQTSFDPKDIDDLKVAAAGIYVLLQRSKPLYILLSMLMTASENEDVKKAMDNATIDAIDFDQILKDIK